MESNVKRKIIIAILIFCMLISTVACSNGGELPTDRGAVTEGNEKTESKTETTEADNNFDSNEKDNTDLEKETIDTGLDELEELVMTDVESVIEALSEEYESLLTEIDTYEKYLKNTDSMEDFYKKIYTETRSICIRLRDYSINYAKTILASDKSFDDKYDELDEIYDCIYEDAGDEIYDEVYDGILDEAYDDIYNGILDDAYGDAEYKEWSRVRSNEYECWSDCRSNVYEEWSDCRSDVYEFWSDVRGAIWSDDIEKAYKKIDDFVEDIEKIKNKNNDKADITIETTKLVDEEVNDKINDEPIKDKAELVDGMRPEFKEAMDSYEVFYEEYCKVIKKYKNSPTDLTILAEYTGLMQKSVEMSKRFEAWDEGELNDAELKYYLEVNGRVTKMLLEASGE